MQDKLSSEERKSKIVDYVDENIRASVPELATIFSVTEATIRRDLIELEQNNKLVRTHGGAKTIREKAIWQTTTLNTRLAKCHKEKVAIAKYVSTLVKDGESIFIDGGSTTLLIAKELVNHKRLMVVTNSPMIALSIAGINDNKVIITGGELEAATDSLLGTSCEECIKQYRTDKAIIGTSGVIIHEGFFAAIPQEAVVKRLMIANAKNVIVATDSTKFGTTAFNFVCDIKKADLIVTDHAISPVDVAVLHEIGTDVVTV
jgi:DeoR/GlpR family transcriptional regulator of sugar metabolism